MQDVDITVNYVSPMVINSAKRFIACFDRQNSLAFGARSWAAFEVRMTTWPLVFNNSGTEKLYDRDGIEG
jgi:hypothetical protein